MIALLLATLLTIDLAAVRNELNPERRSELALTQADTAITAAREAYSDDDLEKTKQALEEVSESTSLAYEALTASGKDPRRNPKHFKRAELSIRRMLRRLEGLRDVMNAGDRALVDSVQQRANEVHDALIRGIMGKKR